MHGRPCRPPKSNLRILRSAGALISGVVIAVAILPAAPVASAAPAVGTTVLIVQTDSTGRFGKLTGLAPKWRAQLRHRLPQLRALSFDVPSAQAAVMTRQLESQPGVRSVQVAPRRTTFANPNDPGYGSQAAYLDAIDAPSAWDVESGSSSVKIAVIDSGVDVTHPDLSSKIAGTYNAVDGSTSVTDTSGHGTFVAGVAAAATNNGVGIAGAGYNSGILAIKAVSPDGYFYPDTEATAITWAVDQGAKVINLSFGGAGSVAVEQQAIEYAQQHGALVVASAGNDGTDDEVYPAAYPGVVAVGATDGSGRASFSSYGPWVTLAAPGTGIYSTTPVKQTGAWQPSYDFGSGTSFSAPLVSGEAALILDANPNMSADDLRATLVDSAHGYAGLGLGAGQVDFRAALTPQTEPSISKSDDGMMSSNSTFGFTATSNAPMVRLAIDGTGVGSAVPVTNGTAQLTWNTWGFSNGTHLVAAEDCIRSGLACGQPSGAVQVLVSNPAPSITSPTNGAIASGTVTMGATSNGGGVAFYVDGARSAFSGTAPYAATIPANQLTDGTHTLTAVSCSTAGDVCNGPVSAPITFATQSLHPAITRVAPNPFSPNGDKRNDTTTLTYSLPDPESVSVQVTSSTGSVVRSVKLGLQAAGSHTWSWDGISNSGVRASDGKYAVLLSTTKQVNGRNLVGSASTTVQLDTSAPTLSSIAGNGATFYPWPDGYLDAFAPATTLNEGGTLTLTIRNSAGATVRTMSTSTAAGRASLSWNGRDSKNAIVAAGTYRWFFTIMDAAGNVRNSAQYTVVVSAKKLVAKSATLTSNGSGYYATGTTKASCAVASKSSSSFTPYGVLLDQNCRAGSQYTADSVAAYYSFTLPAATVYRSLTVSAYGHTNAGRRARLGVPFYNWTGAGSTDWTTGPIVTNTSNAWYTLGTVNAAGHVSGGRVVGTGLLVTTADQTHRGTFDGRYLRLVVSYGVLQ